jgi:hypothetical protein
MSVRRGSVVTALLLSACQLQGHTSPSLVLESFDSVDRVDVHVYDGGCEFTVANPDATELADRLIAARVLNSRARSRGLYRVVFFDARASIARFEVGRDWLAPSYPTAAPPSKFREREFSTLLTRLVEERCSEPPVAEATAPAQCGLVQEGPRADPKEPPGTCWMDADCRAYLQAVEERVFELWEVPRETPAGTIEIGFRISASGCVYGLRVFYASNQLLARSLSDAVQRASPLPPLSGDLEYARDRSLKLAASYGADPAAREGGLTPPRRLDPAPDE